MFEMLAPPKFKVGDIICKDNIYSPSLGFYLVIEIKDDKYYLLILVAPIYQSSLKGKISTSLCFEIDMCFYHLKEIKRK